MKLDRLIGILSVLLQKDRITALELADKFEVSRRTINRDIEALCKAGIPIVTVQGNGGGISVMDGYKIDRTILTSSEMNAILSGLQSLDSVSGTNRYRVLMDKLSYKNTLNADNSIIIDLSYWDKAAVSDKIELIKTAIDNKEQITFYYYSPQNEMQRTIEPYHLIFQWANWYVWGYCTTRCDFRMFKLTRITELKNTGDKNKPRDVPPYIADKLLHTKGEITATVKFSPAVKWRIIDEFGADDLTVAEDGSIIKTFTWSDVPAFISYILTFNENAEILEPDAYRKEISLLLKKISEKYEI